MIGMKFMSWRSKICSAYSWKEQAPEDDHHNCFRCTWDPLCFDSFPQVQHFLWYGYIQNCFYVILFRCITEALCHWTCHQSRERRSLKNDRSSFRFASPISRRFVYVFFFHFSISSFIFCSSLHMKSRNRWRSSQQFPREWSLRLSRKYYIRRYWFAYNSLL